MLRIDHRSMGRTLAGTAILFFLMNASGLFSGTPLRVGLHLLIWASFSAILIVPKTWWTHAKRWTAIGMVAVECAAGIVLYQEIKLAYFLAIFVFASVVRFTLSNSPIPAMLAVVVSAVFFIRFGREDLFSMISFVFLAIAIYFTLRSRLQRNEMYERNKRNLTELQHAYEQLEEASSVAMQNAVLEERTRIAREIHDAVGHSLTSLIVQIQALRYMVKHNPDQAEQSLDGMLAEARRGLHDIRASVHDLADNPAGSGVASLKALLTRMEDSTTIRCTFRDELNGEVEDVGVYRTLFRVLQEAITNVVRHSGADQLDVSVAREAGSLIMRVRDNGCLEPGQPMKEGFGLQMMKGRVMESGGRMHYAILEPHGFQLTVEIPDHVQVDQKDLGKEDTRAARP